MIDRLFNHWTQLEANNERNSDQFLPSGDSLLGLGKVQGRVLRDLDGLLHGGQQTLTSLSSQGGAETLGTSDQKLHHNVRVLLHALTCDANTPQDDLGRESA